MDVTTTAEEHATNTDDTKEQTAPIPTHLAPKFGREPTHVVCKNCNQEVFTKVKKKFGEGNRGGCLMYSMFGCICLGLGFVSSSVYSLTFLVMR
jgi:hypothetical protein